MNWPLELETKSIKEMGNKLRFIIPVILVFLITSCQTETLKFIPEDTIVNTWQNDAGEITFSSDNSFKNATLGIADSSGVWAFNVKDSIITLTSEGVSKDISGEEVLSKKLTELKVKRFDTKELEFVFEGKNSVLTVRSSTFESAFTWNGFFRGLLGMVSLLAIAWLFSSNKRAINWKQIGKGLALQIVVALLILKVDFVAVGFEWVSSKFVRVTEFAHEGAGFLFGSMDSNIGGVIMTFATWVLPTIIFFSALTSLLYYWGILQRIVYVFAWVMKKLLNLSGAESMAAAGNIFLGQTESPLLVKPYLSKMTDSEILCLMTGGMATIAGGVLAAYIGFLGGSDPQEKVFFAKHLLTASVMSAPAAIIFSKILLPETQEVNKELKVPKEKLGSNWLEAISNGTTDGIKLAVNVGAMLIVFISLMAFGNAILGKIGEWTNLNQLIVENTQYTGLSFQFVLGYLLAPLAWLMGVESADMFKVGQLLGEKTVLNEFIAYKTLGDLKATMSSKSIIMATYILCGFANFASIGIQIGGIGALAPDKKATLSKYGFKALIGGTFACLMTAVIVGMMY
jgi:CNT family concentrative nucleoside transporter